MKRIFLLALALTAADPPLALDPSDAKGLTKALLSYQGARVAALEAKRAEDASLDAYLKALQAVAAKKPGCTPAIGQDLEWSWNCPEKK